MVCFSRFVLLLLLLIISIFFVFKWNDLCRTGQVITATASMFAQRLIGLLHYSHIAITRVRARPVGVTATFNEHTQPIGRALLVSTLALIKDRLLLESGRITKHTHTGQAHTHSTEDDRKT